MRFTKKVVSLVAVLAIVCAFAVSAATMGSEAVIAETQTGYTITVPATDVADGEQYTVLVYKLNEAEGSTAQAPVYEAPSSENITFIDQDDFVNISANDAYTIAFALGAVDGDGTYKVLVGGTGVTTAAVGTFTVGGGAELIYGDADGNGRLTSNDCILILRKILGEDVTIDTAICDVDCNGRLTSNDCILILRKILGEDIVLGPTE